MKHFGTLASTKEQKLPIRKPGQRSFLADIDDELLQEFEGIFGDSDETFATPENQPWRNGRAQDLLEELDSMGEEVDREIMEIFLQYGWEIIDKLRKS